MGAEWRWNRTAGRERARSLLLPKESLLTKTKQNINLLLLQKKQPDHVLLQTTVGGTDKPKIT